MFFLRKSSSKDSIYREGKIGLKQMYAPKNNILTQLKHVIVLIPRLLRYHIHKRNFPIVYVAVSPIIMALSRRFSKFSLMPINITSAVSTFIFAIAYGVIEHTLLASPMGISVLVYPLNIHIFEQIYFYHIVMLTLAILISFNPFFDKLIFGIDGTVKRQSILWGMGNILNFIWLEDVFYFVSFGEWPKDVMTSLHLSFYGVVWWYPILLGIASYLYYHTTKIIRKPSLRQQLEKEEEQQDM